MGLGSALVARGLWPPILPAPAQLAESVVQCAKAWARGDHSVSGIQTLVQHGDLNPTNIMVRGANDFSLIDPARLGPWPIGYDLSRLALILRLRLMHRRLQEEWFADHFRGWIDEPVANDGVDRDLEKSVCAEACYCDQELWKWAKTLSMPHAAAVTKSYQLGTLWDLFKVVSYQDISGFKRVWALAECWVVG